MVCDIEADSESDLPAIQRNQQICYFVEYRHKVGGSKSDRDQLQFHIEFLIRDAKRYTGLEECQARGEMKLYNHFNLSMMAVSLMKYQCWATLSQKKNTPFSMRSIKTWFYNRFLTETIFLNLGPELNCNKIIRLYPQCLNIGDMAA
jgi:hypothetical protein